MKMAAVQSRSRTSTPRASPVVSDEVVTGMSAFEGPELDPAALSRRFGFGCFQNGKDLIGAGPIEGGQIGIDLAQSRADHPSLNGESHSVERDGEADLHRSIAAGCFDLLTSYYRVPDHHIASTGVSARTPANPQVEDRFVIARRQRHIRPVDQGAFDACRRAEAAVS